MEQVEIEKGNKTIVQEYEAFLAENGILKGSDYDWIRFNWQRWYDEEKLYLLIVKGKNSSFTKNTYYTDTRIEFFTDWRGKRVKKELHTFKGHPILFTSK